MPNEPNWLPIEAVIDHNQLELAETGERHFVRDFGLLESALARPRNFFGYGEEDTSFEDTISWADALIALVEHRTAEEDFVRAIRPFVVEK